MSARRRFATAVIALATVTGVLGLVSLWAGAQVFLTDEWGDTAGELIESPEVREAVAEFLVAELEGSGALEGAELGGETGSSGDLYGQIETRSVDLLAADPLAAAWVEANRTMHGELVELVESDTPEANVGPGGVRLDLTAVQALLAEELGLAALGSGGETSFQVIPPDRLGELATIADSTRVVPIVLIAITLVLYLIALLVGGGRRLIGFRIGISLLVIAAAGFAVWLLGGLALGAALGGSDAASDGIRASWGVITSLLVWLSTLTGLAGLFIAISTWYAGRVAAGRQRAPETP